tara:strand:- start:145 stop:462 length:318 start_codon:yes stop_codon:yes gene_type:complete
MKKLFENFRGYVNEDDKEESETSNTLIQDLEQLLIDWPACDPEKGDPNGMACQYHKDLEDVVIRHGGKGCGPDAHEKKVEEDTATGPGEGRVVRGGAVAGYIDEA